MQPALNRQTAILLSVLFGFWGWLYTYEKSKIKFWVCLPVSILLLSLVKWTSNIPGESGGYGLVGSFVVSFPIGIIIWGLAITDAFNRTQEQYESHPVKSKKTAILLAVFLGPFSWIYTYQKDAVKFWISIAILILNFALIPTLFDSHTRWLMLRWFRGHSTFSQAFSQIGWNEYLFFYYSADLKPVMFTIPGMLWLTVIITNLLGLRKQVEQVAISNP